MYFLSISKSWVLWVEWTDLGLRDKLTHCLFGLFVGFVYNRNIQNIVIITCWVHIKACHQYQNSEHRAAKKSEKPEELKWPKYILYCGVEINNTIRGTAFISNWVKVKTGDFIGRYFSGGLCTSPLITDHRSQTLPCSFKFTILFFHLVLCQVFLKDKWCTAKYISFIYVSLFFSPVAVDILFMELYYSQVSHQYLLNNNKTNGMPVCVPQLLQYFCKKFRFSNLLSFLWTSSSAPVE